MASIPRPRSRRVYRLAQGQVELREANEQAAFIQWGRM